MWMSRRIALLAVIALAMTACGSQATASGKASGSSAGASASAPASVPAAGQQPPPCVEATLFFDDTLNTMLLANCVHQETAQAAEQIWARLRRLLVVGRLCLDRA
jgi:hypothetical protein